VARLQRISRVRKDNLSASSATPPTAYRWLIAFALFALTLAVYWPVLNHQFIDQYDDGQYVTENAEVQQGITFSSVRWALTASVSSNWHPLTILSHMLDVELYGLNPWGHHLTNILLHATATVLLFFLLYSLTDSPWPSALVAALFALHPMHVESVAWIAERKDVLSACFWFLTTLAYVRYVRKPGLRRYWPVLLLYALGLMAKPMLVTLPFTLLLLDFWPLGRCTFDLDAEGPLRNNLALIVEKTPLFALALTSSIVTFVLQYTTHAVSDLESLPLRVRLANALVSYVAYIVKLTWLTDYAVIYPHTYSAPPKWQLLIAAVILVGVTVTVLWLAMRCPYLLVGWLWYLGTLVPVIGIVQVGSQAMADRYSYIPSIGLFIMLAYSVMPHANQRTYARLIAASSIGLILAIVVATRFQLEHWRNSEVLFRHALAVTKNNATANYALGDYLAEEGRLDEAEEYVAEAMRLHPHFVPGYKTLGLVRLAQGKYASAYESFEELERLEPENGSVHYTMGIILEKMRKPEEATHKFERAAALFREALAQAPDDASVMFNLATALDKLGKRDEALPIYREALRLRPDLLPPDVGEALLNSTREP